MENYIDMIIKGYEYICDRCASLGKSTPITYGDWWRHVENGFRYCTPCWNYIHICSVLCHQCQSFYKLRSTETILYLNCPIDNSLITLTRR